MGNRIPSEPSKFKLARLRHKNEPKEHFIIKHFQNNTHTDTSIDVESLDQRRVVFISLLGIYQTWRRVPSVILYSSIFLMPLKRQWIYKPSQFEKELKSHFVSKLSTFSDDTETHDFIQLLRWKDKQSLVIWMLDDYDTHKQSTNTLINPFWYYFSDKLSNMYDPITGNTYNKLHLNEDWWQTNQRSVGTNSTNISIIVNELMFLTMKFNAIKEILYQSNPNSLNPMKMYTTPCINVTQPLSIGQIATKASSSFTTSKSSIEYVKSTE
eukprot:759550_1